MNGQGTSGARRTAIFSLGSGCGLRARLAVSVMLAAVSGSGVSSAQGQQPPPAPTMATCERLLKNGEVDRGVPCLRVVLRAQAEAADDGRTLKDYRGWAEAFLGARDVATAISLYEEGLATRAAARAQTVQDDPAGKAGATDQALSRSPASPRARAAAELGLLHLSYSYHLLRRTPDKAKALSHARTALALLERTIGRGAYETVHARDNLATLLTDSGAVAPGLNLAETNFDIALRALGEDEPLTWRVSNNFAEALRSIGRPEAAIPIDRTLLKKRVAHYGEGSIQALVSASNLALSYLALGDQQQALKYFRAQGYYGEKLGDRTSEHVAQAKAWISYTNILFSPDPQLRPQELEALAALKDWNGAPDLLRVKAAQLAAIQYEKQGKARQGLALRQAAYEMSAASFAEHDPTTFDALLGVAQAQVRNQETAKALEVFGTLDRQLYDWTLREVGTAGNRYIAETTRVLADNFLYEFGRFALQEETARPAFADALSRWKTMESGERRRLRLVVDNLPEDVKPQAYEVIRLMGRQQEVLSERRTAAERSGDAALVATLQEKSDALSARLKALPVPMATPLSDQIDETLASQDAVLNFSVITRRQGARSSSEAITDQRLLAVVRRKGKAETVVDLGDFRDLQAHLIATSVEGSLAKDMYAVLFGKLSGQLEGVERLFIVPDASLFGVPFAAFQDASGKPLDELYEVHLLTREDALPTAVRRDRLASGGKAVLAGGLDFSAGKERGPRALPASAGEVERINGILKAAGYNTTLLTSSAGTERALKVAIPGASIVHLATHGFFDSPHDNLSALWRGGLVLAQAGKQRPPKVDGTDGYLYADELMDWDLSAADLVVLSACETALGDTSAISAIRGLPTALSIAGARRSILTLWAVDDAGAANFMATFYRHAAEPEVTYAQALRRTRLDAIAGKIPDAADARLWASFVMFEG